MMGGTQRGVGTSMVLRRIYESNYMLMISESSKKVTLDNRGRYGLGEIVRTKAKSLILDGDFGHIIAYSTGYVNVESYGDANELSYL